MCWIHSNYRGFLSILLLRTASHHLHSTTKYTSKNLSKFMKNWSPNREKTAQNLNGPPWITLGVVLGLFGALLGSLWRPRVPQRLPKGGQKTVRGREKEVKREVLNLLGHLGGQKGAQSAPKPPKGSPGSSKIKLRRTKNDTNIERNKGEAKRFREVVLGALREARGRKTKLTFTKPRK